MRHALAFLMVLSVAGIPTAQASITEAQAVRILIGEASNQGARGMQAVAEVLRRRGSIKGFYGLKAKHVDRQPKWVWAQAKKAWEQSRTSNLTNGATLFENEEAFGKPYWAKKLKPVAKIGSHVFYAEHKAKRKKK